MLWGLGADTNFTQETARPRIAPSAQLTLTKGTKSWSSAAVAAALELVDPLASGPWLSLTAAAFFFFFHSTLALALVRKTQAATEYCSGIHNRVFAPPGVWSVMLFHTCGCSVCFESCCCRRRRRRWCM
eukprot:FR744381.1.p2 GENE.FR744381.1~~FR744381.1.p2  ORF type:complete len:129 (-),score=12.01 FR744381.1:389-775(-)